MGYQRLVLSACHPLYSAAQRIIVFARLDPARAGAGQEGMTRADAGPRFLTTLPYTRRPAWTARADILDPHPSRPRASWSASSARRAATTGSC